MNIPRRRFTHANIVTIGLFAVLSGVFLFLTIGSVQIGHWSSTTDEPWHFRYGKRILAGNSDRFDDSKMPISELNALSSLVLRKMAGDRITNDWQILNTGRVATTLFSLGVGLLCAIWAAQLGGRWAGLLAFALYVFEPNILAHSSLITTDIYAAGTITLALFLFWRFLRAPSLAWGMLAGLALGLAQIAKYTSVLLFPMIVLLALLHYRRPVADQLRRRAYRQLLRSGLRWGGYGLLFLVLALMVVNVGFLFNRTGTRFGDYDLRSPQLSALQASSPLLRSLPVPVPYPYLQGLDLVMYNERTGENYGRVYLLGEVRQGKGFLGYFLVATLYKVPLGLLALFALSLLDWAAGVRRKRPEWGRTYLLIPILVFALYFNFLFRAQIGLRLFLVAFPPALVFTAQLARSWQQASGWARAGLSVLGAWIVVSVLSYFPSFIPYFNELVPNRRLAYRVLADSNIDWAQTDEILEETLDEHPEYNFQPERPTAGVIVVGVNGLTGVIGDPETYRWLRDNFTPVGDIGYAVLIFQVSPSDLKALATPEGGE
jgi:4-amino-4-deoxy-L-arabinose transferase-like glycosyltransferase